MSQEIEIEYKTLLSATDYQRLLSHFAVTDADFFTQTNVYFDTSDFTLKSKGMGLRIRLFDDDAELTLKSPLAAEQTGLLETTDNLTLADANRLIDADTILSTGAVAKFLAQLDVSPADLHVQANLTTKRWEHQLTESALLVLDESWYHGQHDYELEMEVHEAETGHIFFTNFLTKFAIPYHKGTNKIQRAVTAKKG